MRGKVEESRRIESQSIRPMEKLCIIAEDKWIWQEFAWSPKFLKLT